MNKKKRTNDKTRKLNKKNPKRPNKQHHITNKRALSSKLAPQTVWNCRWKQTNANCHLKFFVVVSVTIFFCFIRFLFIYFFALVCLFSSSPFNILKKKLVTASTQQFGSGIEAHSIKIKRSFFSSVLGISDLLSFFFSHFSHFSCVKCSKRNKNKNNI